MERIITLEQALESYDYGFAVTYDGDEQKIMFCTTCNICGEYFESYTMDIYCKSCVEQYQNNLVNTDKA